MEINIDCRSQEAFEANILKSFQVDTYVITSHAPVKIKSMCQFKIWNKIVSYLRYKYLRIYI